ncbi:hypothetical protein [Bacillus sp. T33-2]|uniref:hypothetical protein n=1 Tax=Bacillus sp. T33-2 TaxID=2054168 RepID=UPI000C78A72B|nr:hypothetical protein [Bacillus sp. T33-2]PLR99659.1 hypothetical protein CVD19_00950 [Bacillus sp. T33-2]
MANYLYLTLDTTNPSNPTISIDGGATYATNQLVTLSIGTSDADTTGYQMLIWGNVDTAYDTNIQATEGTSQWIAYNNSKQVKLSTGDGAKTIYLKIRDDVHNSSAQVSDSINLDTSIATVTVTNPDVNKISKNAGKNVASFTFSVDKAFTQYQVKVVSATSASQNTGTIIPTTAGSTNTSGTGTFASGTPITVTINGADLETASTGDGQKIVKVFVLDEAGKWSA